MQANPLPSSVLSYRMELPSNQIFRSNNYIPLYPEEDKVCIFRPFDTFVCILTLSLCDLCWIMKIGIFAGECFVWWAFLIFDILSMLYFFSSRTYFQWASVSKCRVFWISCFFYHRIDPMFSSSVIGKV